MAGRAVPVDVRLAAVLADRDGEVVNVSELCRRLGISRQSYYLLRRRFAEGGLAGVLEARSRAPRSRPAQTAAAVEERIVRLRKELGESGWDNGARSIRARLGRDGVSPLPAASTIHRVLRRHGLVIDEPRKRPHASLRRFEYPAPNACWQIDGTSWWLADGTEVKIIRVIDDHSRKALASRVARSENLADTRACLLAAIARHGPPAMVLSDQGVALCGKPGRAAQFRELLTGLGIAAVSASARHPQTCGKAERSHRTLQLWLRGQPPARSLTALQTQIEAFDAAYNTHRPHQGIGGATPEERYTAAAKAGPGGRLDPPALAVSEQRVSSRGEVKAGRHSVQVGREWQAASVTVLQSGLNVAIFHTDTLVRQLTLDPTRRYQPNGRPRGRGPHRRRRIVEHTTAPTRSARRPGEEKAAQPEPVDPTTGGAP